MPRYIDADALEELFREVIGHIAKERANEPVIKGSLEHMVRASAMVIEMIQDAPTADVVERKKGKWIQRGDMPWYYYCSNCHRVISVVSTDQMEKFHAFCGTCGADMRGGTDG